MAPIVGEFIVQRMIEWGVRRVYGYPGDGINGVFEGLRKSADKIQFIQTRHEEMAAFMACAHAKFTGEVGVCIATSGPGAIHLLNGLYDAKMDHAPVVAIVGHSATSALGSDYQQEVDLPNLFKDVAKEFVTQVSSPLAVRHAIDRAIRIALDQNTVTCVILPKDVQEEKAVAQPPQMHDAANSGLGISVPHMIPKEHDLKAAADVLNGAQRIAILVGQGALAATDEVIAVADLLGAGISKAWLGKAVVPDDVPFCCGSIGLLGTRPSWNMMQECDALLVVGSSFPYAEFYPPKNRAKGVQIDRDGRMLSLRYPMEVNLKGDAKETLAALIPMLKRNRDRAWQKKLIDDIQNWWGVVEKAAMEEANPINPQRVFFELSPKLPDNCIIAADSGTSANWFARDLKIRRGMMASGSGNLATMGCAVPYAVAAKFAFPDRVAFALAGDGAMQMNGINTLITVAKYWKEWSDPRLITLVLNNRDLNMVTWEQRVMTGDIKFSASQEIPDFPYAGFADSIGLKGIRVERPEEIAGAWDRALSADRPVVVEAITDPNVAPLPPHITLEQAKNFSVSVLKGDPDAAGMVKHAVKEMIDAILPHRK